MISTRDIAASPARSAEVQSEMVTEASMYKDGLRQVMSMLEALRINAREQERTLACCESAQVAAVTQEAVLEVSMERLQRRLAEEKRVYQVTQETASRQEAELKNDNTSSPLVRAPKMKIGTRKEPRNMAGLLR